MLSFLHQKPQPLIGLDIQSDEIRLLHLKHNKQEMILENFIITEIPSGIMLDGKIQQVDALITLLSQIVQNAELNHHPVTIAMPAHCVISQSIQLTKKLNPDEIETELKNNLQHYLPGIQDELCFDFSILDEQKIMLVAARFEQLKMYIDAVNQAGLRVEIVDVDFYALLRAVNFCLAAKNEIVAIIDVNTNVTQFIVLQNKEIIFKQQILAEQDLLQQLQRILQLYFSSQNPSIQQIFLSGKIINLSNIENYLRFEKNLNVKYANPFSMMKLMARIDKNELEKSAPRLLISCGLALRGV